MKAIVPTLFFATLGIPAGIVCTVLLAALVFWVVTGSDKNTEEAE